MFFDLILKLLSGMFQNGTPATTLLPFPDITTTMLLIQQILAL